jgi:hypothetical protein
MDYPQVPQDDLLDVLEMTRKIENYMGKILNDAELSLAMSAIMNATINCIISQSSTLDEIIYYRNILYQFFDHSIRSLKIKDKDLG